MTKEDRKEINLNLYDYKEFSKRVDKNKKIVRIIIALAIFIFAPFLIFKFNIESQKSYIIFFYSTIILFILFLTTVYFVYRIPGNDIKNLKEEMDKSINIKLSGSESFTRDGHIKEVEDKKLEILRERKIKFLESLLEVTSRSRSVIKEIVFSLIITLLVSFSGFVYGYLNDIVDKDVEQKIETSQTYSQEDLNSETEEQEGVEGNKLIFSLTTHIILIVITALSIIFFAFANVHALYYYDQIIHKIMLDTI